MEQVCQSLGYQPDAWVPGQTAPHSLDGRILYAPNQAYNWTCGAANSPRLTREQLTKGCQIWKTGSTAYTTDPNYAYSWVCLYDSEVPH